MGDQLTKQRAEEILGGLSRIEYNGKPVLKPYIDSLLSQIGEDLPEISAKFDDFSQGKIKDAAPYSSLGVEDQQRWAFFGYYQGKLPAFQRVIEAYTEGKYTGEGVSAELGEVRLIRV